MGGALIVSGGVLEVATLGGYTIGFGVQMGAGAALISTGLATTTYHARDIPLPKTTKFPISTSQEYYSNGLITVPVPEGYGNYSSTMQKKKQIDERLPNDPDQLLNDPNWAEISHPNAKGSGHRTFENTKTGEKIRHDAGKPKATGHKAAEHWHRHNPDSTGNIDKYLDAKGNPVPDGHPDSHLYPK